MTPESWLKNIQNAKITVLIQDGRRKVHFLLENGEEMVEEYNMDTNVVVRRIWKKKNSFGTDQGWIVEIGDPEPKENNIEKEGIQESSNTPFVTQRITKTSLEWRIRNLPYPSNVYSITAEKDNTITVRTSNKKYFKKLRALDLERIGLKPEQERISFKHQYNTLIIMYKKPPELFDVEKKILSKILQIKATESPNQCPVS
ncbi:protein DPCD-like [Cataglyphis hispanica]|uniref:protein DPCD-like n=1 Tax=Cataglyphis hispanica TaxID=1086592 RepID=UPI00217F42A7|nr:protein DPCD-like [Cataglyphis hispanica]XP_050449226.1 protein DPCD-like [Cataglyphis hispanica]